MSNYYIHRGSFIAPVKRKSPDGWRQAFTAIRKIHRGEPAAMQKGAETAEQPSSFGENADETLQEIKKVHESGRRAGVPQHTAQGDEVVGSKSVSMVKRARARRIHVTNRMLSPLELSKAFAEQGAGKELQKRDLGSVWRSMSQDEKHAATVRASKIPSARWNAMTKHDQLRELTKGLTTARPRVNDCGVTDDYGRNAPESSNSNWNDVHANTGATNDWHDQITPTTKPTRVTFPQFNAPGQSTRDDAIEAIKQDLSKPKRMGASPNVDDSFTRER
jgi:hypothetical protein